MGFYLLRKSVAVVKVTVKPVEKLEKAEKVKPAVKTKVEKAVPTLDISSIVGKKS